MSRLRRILALILLSTIVLTGSSQTVLALSEAQLEFFAENNILFFDPEGGRCSTSGGVGSVTVSGDTAEEMIWSGLYSYGFTPAQVAGIMGNIAGESAGNPVRHEQELMNSHWRGGAFDLFANAGTSYGIGLVQWSFGRRVGFMNHVRDNAPDLVRYFLQPEIYSRGAPTGNQFIARVQERGGNIEDVRRLMALSLEYVIKELHNQTTYHNGTPRNREGSNVPRHSSGRPAPSVFPSGATEMEVLTQLTTLELASEFFLFSFEVPCSVLNSPACRARGGGTYESYWRAANHRAGHARRYYDQFAGTSIVGGGGVCTSGWGGGDMNATAIEFAWDCSPRSSRCQPVDNPKPAYLAALQELGFTDFRDRGIRITGASCDVFVATVARITGTDPDFPPTGTSIQLTYLANSPLWEEIPNLRNTSNLQGGEVLVLNGHIMIIVNYNGAWQTAHASINHRTAERGPPPMFSDSRGMYRIFRRAGT